MEADNPCDTYPKPRGTIMQILFGLFVIYLLFKWCVYRGVRKFMVKHDM